MMPAIVVMLVCSPVEGIGGFCLYDGSAWSTITIGDPLTITVPLHSAEPSALRVKRIASAVRYALGVTVSFSSYSPALRLLTTDMHLSVVSKEIALRSAESLQSTWTPF